MFVIGSSTSVSNMLSVSDAANFNVIVSASTDMHSQWWDNPIPATIENARFVIYPIVDKFKSHPSVKGYNILDEPG